MKWLLTMFSLLITLGMFAEDKQIFAHYMGCYPVAAGPTAHHRKNNTYDHNSKDFAISSGGKIYNWDLVPPETELNYEQAAKLDIARAMRGGFDGFALDAYAGDVNAKKMLDALFKVAEEQKLPFKITICLDPSCLPKDPEDKDVRVNAYSDAINYLLKNHGNSPNLARRDGKVLVFGYHSKGIMNLPATKENWPKLVQAYRDVEKKVGQPIYFYFCIGAFSGGVPANSYTMEEAVAFLSKNFPAVGDFFDGYYKDGEIEKLGEIVRANKAEWGQPVWFQYNNRTNSQVYGKNGFEKLRQMWEMARKLDCHLLQFVTWNDYGEDTNIAPGYNTNYAVLMLNRYFIDWWKAGKAPAVKRDQIYVSFRRYNDDAVVFPFQSRVSRPGGVIEVTTILKEPGKVTLPGRDIAYDAPAGMSFRQFPVTPGKVSVELARGGKAVLSLTAPEEITDRPFRPDSSMCAFSSECESEWQKDFPDQPFLAYSEYGDSDGNGLPNWFERYYFGKLLDLKNLPKVDPAADPDNDGATNLEEYRRQTDPVVADKPYQTGDVWVYEDIFKNNQCSNPDLDFNRRPVWFYLYKHGEHSKIDHAPPYQRVGTCLPNVPYAGKFARLSPSSDPVYKYIHGWIAGREADGKWQVIMRPRNQVALILGWRSPVDGEVSLAGKVVPNAGQDGITLEVRGPEGVIGSTIYKTGEGGTLDYKNIKVKAGDYIYLVADASPGSDTDVLYLEDLTVKLESLL